MKNTIRFIRKNKGFSQSRLAERSGMTRQTISNIELGRTSPRLKDLEKIALALGVRLGDLLSLEPSPALTAA